MPKNCVSYFQKGVKAAVLNGYNAQNMSACNIKRIQKGISAPGLGKPGGRRSRKASPKSRRGTRRMRGGAPLPDMCANALAGALPDAGDYDRMQGLDCESIDAAEPYDTWVEGQIARARTLPGDECGFLAALCARVNNIKLLDMESCAPFGAANVFLDTEGKVVISNPR
jgi:hypothetical protein